MFSKLKQKLFPFHCSLKNLMQNHDESVKQNQEAHERLINACGDNCDIKKKDKPKRLADAFFNNEIRGF